MKQILLIAIGLLLISCQPQNSKSDSKEGISQNRLSRIDTMLEQAILDNKIPGAVAFVSRNGQTLYHKSFGISNPITKERYKNDDIFRIASMTKAVTSLAVLILWEEGKFFLDDPIEKYIPEFKNTGILNSFNAKDSTFTTTPNKKKITIRHLLTHTSGMGYGEIDGNSEIRAIYWKNNLRDIFAPNENMQEVAAKIAKQPLHHEPDKKFTYSLGIDVLGYFIEKISGKPFPEFLKERIFNPLEMKDTYFTIPKEHHSRLVPVLTQKNGLWKMYSANHYNIRYPLLDSKTFFSGGAGLSSTVEDYAKFLHVFINQGRSNGHQLIGKKTCELLFENQLTGIENWSHGLAFGLLSKKDLRKGTGGSEGTLTWGGYFNTSYFADPNEKIIGIIYKQTRDISNDDTSQRFRELVFQSIVE